MSPFVHLHEWIEFFFTVEFLVRGFAFASRLFGRLYSDRMQLDGLLAFFNALVHAATGQFRIHVIADGVHGQAFREIFLVSTGQLLDAV